MRFHTYWIGLRPEESYRSLKEINEEMEAVGAGKEVLTTRVRFEGTNGKDVRCRKKSLIIAGGFNDGLIIDDFIFGFICEKVYHPCF